MPTSIQDYRAFGYWELPAPLVIAEGDAPTVVPIVALTGQPTGIYTLCSTIVWTQDKDKHFDLILTYPGSSNVVVTKEAEGPDGSSTSTTDVSIFVCTDGIINISSTIEFPNQGGVGDGTVLEGLVYWRRESELP